MVAGEELGQAVLGDVGILELVDQQVAIALVIPGLHFGGVLQQVGRPQQQVVKVQGVLAGEGFLVVAIDAGADVDPVGAVFVLGVVGGLRHLAGVLQEAFGGGDAGEDGAGLVAFYIHIGQLHGGFDGVQLVVLVVDGEVGVEGHALAVAAQDAGANGVEGAHSDGGAASRQQAVQAVAHFPGRLVGESDGQDLPGGDTALAHQVGDAVGNDAGFAGAGAGYDEQGAVGVQHGLLLGFVEALQDGRGAVVVGRGAGAGVVVGVVVGVGVVVRVLAGVVVGQVGAVPVGRGRRFRPVGGGGRRGAAAVIVVGFVVVRAAGDGWRSVFPELRLQRHNGGDYSTSPDDRYGDGDGDGGDKATGADLAGVAWAAGAGKAVNPHPSASGGIGPERIGCPEIAPALFRLTIWGVLRTIEG